MNVSGNDSRFWPELLRQVLLWIRGGIFTVLVPGMIGLWLPVTIANQRPARGVWNVGWVLVAIGALIYLFCLLRFLCAGGTPGGAIARPLRSLIGDEPHRLVQSGLYARTRNPMYVGVLTAVFGQAIAFASLHVLIYGAILAAWLHFVVVRIEEPHLRREQEASYAEYCRRVPRWLSWRLGGP